MQQFEQRSLDTYIRAIAKHSLLSKEQEQALGLDIKAGEEKALQDMVSHNLRLVLKIALRYQHHGLTLLDLISEGNLGLIHAAQKFDAKKGFRFSTYACPWIQQAIERAILNQGHTIRVPIHLAQQVKRIDKARQALAHDLQREASLREAIDTLSENPSRHLSHALQAHDVISLHHPKVSEDPYNLEELISLEEDVVVDNLLQTEAERNITHALSHLDETERFIIVHRYGLNGLNTQTLQSLSKQLNMPPETIRRHQTRALGHLKKCLKH